MQRMILWLSVILVAASMAAPALAADGNAAEVALFNGRDLSGWGCFLDDPNVAMKDVWSVQDGILVCKGEPMGYLATKKDYTKYQYNILRMPAEGGDPVNLTGDLDPLVNKWPIAWRGLPIE